MLDGTGATFDNFVFSPHACDTLYIVLIVYLFETETKSMSKKARKHLRYSYSKQLLTVETLCQRLKEALFC